MPGLESSSCGRGDQVTPQIVGRRNVFTSPWFRLVETTVRDMPGSAVDQHYYAVDAADYVSVLAVAPEQDVILVRQYRPALGRYTLELPSGHVEHGQTPEEAARQELLDETGYQANELVHLGTLSPDTGRLSNRLWCFAAAKPTLTAQVPELGLTVEKRPLGHVWELVASGELDHAINLAVLTLAVAVGARSGIRFPYP